MTAIDPSERSIFTTRLTPHRSMSPGLVWKIILGFCAIQIVMSVPFLLVGAWPVAGFMGLDVLGLYVAFRVSFRAAQAYETVDVTPIELVFAKVGARGQRREWRFNPSWVRLEKSVHEEFGTERVSLVSRGERVEIGAFLGPEQKAALARELDLALSAARLGPRFS